MKLPLTYPCIAKFKTVVELKDFRPKTKKEYVRYLCKLAEHFQCDPAKGNRKRTAKRLTF